MGTSATEGFSRAYLAVHWTNDVAASLLWTTVWLCAVLLILRGRLGPDLRSLRPRNGHPRPGTVASGTHDGTGPAV
jgi:hypothetical protein